jgi:nonribosomal peptide synthetase DhbF
MRDLDSDTHTPVIRADSTPAAEAPAAGAFALSMPQLGLWAAEHMHLGGSAGISAQYSEILGAIDIPLFERASRQVLEETEALRLCFGEVAGQPQQWVVPPGDWSLPVVDLSEEQQPSSAAVAWMQQQRAQPIDPRCGRAFRWTLLRLAPSRFVWSFQVHHLIMDGFGRNLIWRRLEQVYAALAAHELAPPVELEPLRQRFADEQAYYRSADFEADRRFFSALLAQRPACVSLSRKPAAASRDFRRETTRVVEPTTAGLREAARGGSLARVMVAAAALLQRSELGGDDIVIGLVVSARVTPADRRTPSMLTNIVPLRLQLDEAMTIDELLSHAASAIRATMPHQRYPSQALRRDLHLRPMAADAYSLTVNFMPFDSGRSFAGHPASTHNLSHGPISDLVVAMFDAPGSAELRVDLNGNVELYEGAELARLTRRLDAILAQLAAPGGNRSIAALLEAVTARTAPVPVLAERSLLEAWGRNERPYPKGRTVVELFTEMARARPQAVALIAGAQRWSYQELDECANAVAAELHRCGVTHGEHVPLLLPRGAALIICQLGVLKLGAVYVPIEPGLPAERHRRLLKLLRARVGIGAAGSAATSLHWLPGSVSERRQAAPPPAPGSSAEDAAYVMFTSGSTGQPKGVVVPHRGIARLVRGQDFVGMGPEESWLQMAPTSFDASTLEIWAPLLNGGRCIVVEADVPTPALLSAVIAREGVSSAYLTASLFNVLVDERPECLAGLRLILIGGEALSPPHVRRALERLPGVRLMNGYGPTENTTITCCHPITPADVAPGRSVPIGRPVGNSTVQVLDGEGHMAPIGVAGELVTGGDGVALGYLGLPEQTALSFIPDLTSATPHARRYRTGDLARWRHDGLLEFLGRIDEQLKINGYRIEPGEIAAVLAEHPGVRRAAVVPRKTGTADTRLLAYVVPEAAHQGNELSARLAQHLAERLPPYMMVASFVYIDALPLKPNGKLDVAALPEPTAYSAPAATSPSTGPGSDDAVLALMAELLSQPVAREDNLYALGADSLGFIRLVERLESRLGVKLSIGEVMKGGEVAEILELVGQRCRLTG